MVDPAGSASIPFTVLPPAIASIGFSATPFTVATSPTLAQVTPAAANPGATVSLSGGGLVKGRLEHLPAAGRGVRPGRGAPGAGGRAPAGGGLQAGLYQKSGTATFSSAPLASVALDLIPDAVTAGTTVALAPTAGQQAVYVDGQDRVQLLPAAIGIGTLVAW